MYARSLLAHTSILIYQNPGRRWAAAGPPLESLENPSAAIAKAEPTSAPPLSSALAPTAAAAASIPLDGVDEDEVALYGGSLTDTKRPAPSGNDNEPDEKRPKARQSKYFSLRVDSKG